MWHYGDSGTKSRGVAVLCMVGMVIISAAQLAMAIYLLLNGMKEALLIATESFMIYSVRQALVLPKIMIADSDGSPSQASA